MANIQWGLLDPNMPARVGASFNLPGAWQQGRQNALAMRQAEQTQALNAMKIQQGRQTIADQNRLREISRQSGGDIGQTITGLQQEGLYGQAGTLQKQQIAQRSLQIDQQLQLQTMRQNSAEMVSASSDNEILDTARRSATENARILGTDPSQAIAQIEQTYTQGGPQALRQEATRHAIDAKTFLSNQASQEKFAYQQEKDIADRAQREAEFAQKQVAKGKFIRNEDGTFTPIVGGEKRALSAQQTKLISEAAQLPLVLDPLNEILKVDKDEFGPIVGRAGSANPYDTKAQTIDAAMRRAAQVVGSYMEGGVLRKEDEIKYRKMLPQLTDTPAVAKEKLVGVKSLLKAKEMQLLADYASAGFDVSQFEEKPKTKAITPEPEMMRGRAAQVTIPEDAEFSGINPATGQMEYFNAQGERL